MDQKTKEIVERLRASIGDSFTPDPRFDDCQEAASLIESLSERVGELDDAFENVEMQIVDGPTDAWVMLPKVEWENIKRPLLSKQEDRG